MVPFIYLLSILSLFVSLSLLLSVPVPVSCAPIVGGPGYGLYFNHQRSDVVGLIFNGASTVPLPVNEFTIEFFARNYDRHAASQTPIAFSQYDGAQLPPLVDPDAFQIRFKKSETRVYRGVEQRCKAPLAGCNSYWRTTSGSTGDRAFGHTHYAITFASATGNVIAYINGTEFLNKVQPAGVGEWRTNITWACYLLGQEPDSLCNGVDEAQAFDGVIDELRIWRVARTAAQISASVNTSFSGPAQDLVAYFKFDDPIGEAAAASDASGHGHFAALGLLPNDKPWLQYSSTHGSVQPTRPKYVASRAGVVGTAPLQVFLNQSQSTAALVIRLLASDSSATTLNVVLATLSSNPSCQLTHFDGSSISAGHTVKRFDASDAQSPRLLYTCTATTAFQDPNYRDSFTYSVGSTVQSVYVQPYDSAAPPRQRFLFDEGLSYFTLGGLFSDGYEADVFITSAPTKGSLYDPPFSTIDDPFDGLSSTLSVTAVPIVLPSSGTFYQSIKAYTGALQYYGKGGVIDSLTQYAQFSYCWRHPVTLQYTASSSVSIYLKPKPTPPVPASGLVSLPAASMLAQTPYVIRMNISNFFNNTQSSYAHSRISRFPLFGQLFQVDSTSGSVLLSSPLSPDAFNPIVASWANRVLAYSSTYNLNNNVCAATRLDLCYDAASCAANCPGDFSQHPITALGPFDSYPQLADLSSAWEPFNKGQAEYLEFAFDTTMFISQVQLYENYSPGTVTRIAITKQWMGNTTQWDTLWAGKPAALSKAFDIAQIFAPAFCVFPYPSRWVRVEFDGSVVPTSYFSLDAIQILGTLAFSTSAVASTNNEIAYVPHKGIYIADPTVAFDSFAFSAYDCQLTSPSSATISLFSPALDPLNPPSLFGAPDLNSFVKQAAFLQQTLTLALSLDALPDDVFIRSVAVRTDLALADYMAAFSLTSPAAPAIVATALACSCATSGHSFGLRDSTTGLVTPFSYSSLPWSLTLSDFVTTGPNRESACDLTISLRVSYSGYADRVYYQSLHVALAYPNGENLYTLSSANQAAFSALAYIFITLTLLSVLFVFLFRENPVLKASGPLFLAVMLCGCLLAFITVPLLVAPATDSSCMAAIWTGHLAFSLIFGSLFAKTFRIGRIFNQHKLQVVKINNTALFLRVLALLGAVSLYLLIWSVAQPPRPTSVVESAGSGSSTLSVICSSAGWGWSNLILIFEGLIVVYGVYLCFVTRNLPSRFSESRQIAMCLYNLSIIGGLVVIISKAAFSWSSVSLQFQAGGVLLVTLIILILIILPKIYNVAFQVEDTDNYSITYSPTNQQADKQVIAHVNKPAKSSLRTVDSSLPPPTVKNNYTTNDGIASPKSPSPRAH